MRKFLIPLAVLVGVMSLAGCTSNEALTEKQIRQIVREEIRQEISRVEADINNLSSGLSKLYSLTGY